ncbi:MAG TPA: hypothetical protein VKT80_07760, partial [Chloroflexota bacterium]|nr:hypothetical protein [Chloroflexota bacterium]
IVLFTICALVEFSILLVNDMALANGVRSAAHFAATSPRAWSNADPVTDTATIEGWIQPATTGIPNNDARIGISYLDGNTGATCGQYSQASNAFVGVGGATVDTCVVKHNLIQVQANYTYTFLLFPSPTLLNIPYSVVITKTAVIVEEN